MSASGEELRDEAVGRLLDVEEYDRWKSMATTFIEMLDPGEKFVVEHIRRAAGDPPGDGRLMGGVILSASKRGLIRRTGEIRRATRPVAHATDMTVWVRV